MFQISTPTDAQLRTFTPRVERNGDDDVSAASLGLTITGPNTLLDALQPGLRDMLYKADDDQPLLLGVEPSTPTLRCKGVEHLQLSACFEGWTLQIDQGLDEDEFAIGGCKVDKFVVFPSEGGSISLQFRVGSSDIDEREAGWLYGRLRQVIGVRLLAPKPKAPAIDGTVGHPGAAAQQPDAGDLFAREHGGPEDEDDDSEGGTADVGAAA